MARKSLDCRDVPSDSACTLALTGDEDEVLRAGVAHAVDVHGHHDDEALRAGLRAQLRDAPEAPAAPGSFLQLFEFTTARLADFEATEDQWVEAIGDERTARWAITTEDRSRPGTYLQIVAFPDHDAAVANSGHPATGVFADRLGKLADTPPTFRDLDVRRASSWG